MWYRYNIKFSWLPNKEFYGTSWENERFDHGNEKG